VTETVTATLALKRWQGEKAVYHLVTFTGAAAKALNEQALLYRLEFGRSRGFGSLKVMARIGATEWKTSLFPQRPNDDPGADKHWLLLISKKVMKAEDLVPNDAVNVTVTPI